MLRSWIYLITIIFMLLGVYVFTDLYIVVWALLIIASLVVSSILLLFFRKKSLDIKLASSWSTYQSEEGIFEITVHNKSLFPINKMKCTLTFYNQLTNEKMEKDTFLMIKGKGEVRVPLHFTSKQIGRINLDVDKVIVYDYLHLVGRAINFNTEEQPTYIIPHHIPIQFIEKHGDMGIESGMQQPNNALVADGREMIGIREYQAGDNAKHIHWKLTPKFNFPIVKEFSELVSKQILVLYDTYHNGNTEAISTKIETFLSISTSLIDAGYEHQIAWFEQDTQKMKQEDIYLKEQLIPSQTSILSIKHQQESENLVSDFLNQSMPYYTHIYVVTSEQNAAIKNMNRTSQVTILTYSESKTSNNEINSDDIFIARDTLEENLRYLTI